MRYIPNSAEGQKEMLREIGADSLEDLFVGIPQELRLRGLLNLPPALTEPELVDRFKEYANRNAAGFVSFLGAGVNDHYIPTVIDSLISRGEFLTSYTPYQAEITQGTLQAIFEFQTFICQLTDMEVSNASMYDGSTALTEAILMSARVTQKSRFLLAESVHPEYRAVAQTYTRHQNLTLDVIGTRDDGTVNLDDIDRRLSSDVAAVVVQSPNFFGNIEPLGSLAELAHQKGALLVVCVAEALSFGICQSPGSAGADIVCGEAQSLGIPMSFGGPHVGFLACREKFLRNLPGRLVGQTVDSGGKRGFVLTLSTREQHIRREKATSNICTNQSLFALMATIYCSLLGKNGIREVARQNIAKTQYALAQIKEIGAIKLVYPGRRFNEIVVQLPVALETLSAKFNSARMIPGLPLQQYYPALSSCLLLSFTETKRKSDIDRLIQLLAAS